MAKRKLDRCPRCGYIPPEKKCSVAPLQYRYRGKCSDCSGCGPVLWGKKKTVKRVKYKMRATKGLPKKRETVDSSL